MHVPGRQLHRFALVAASLAVLGVVHLPLFSAHALEHLEQARATDPSGGAPQGDHEGEADCGLCLSLAQGRTALVSKPTLAPVRTPLLRGIESVAPLPAPRLVLRAPESPRAPPLG